MKKIINSPTIMTILSYFSKFGGLILLLPIILIKFSSSEISVWLLFSLIINLSLISDSGFGPTIIRVTSYFYNGMENIPKKYDDFKNITKHNHINFQLLNKSIETFNLMYLFIGMFSTLILFTLGYFIVRNSIEMINNNEMVYMAFYLLSIRIFYYLQYIKWSSFLSGINKVAQIKKFESIIETLKYSSMIISLLYFNAKIFDLILLDTIFVFILFLSSKYLFKKWYIEKQGFYNLKYKFDKQIFQSIFPSTWRLAILQYSGFLVTNSSSIIVSQLQEPLIISSFLFTQRIMLFIRQISGTPIYSNLPKIFSLLVEKNKEKLNFFVIKFIRISMVLQFLFLLLLISIGGYFIDLLNVKTTLLPMNLLLLMSVILMFELHQGIHAQIYIGTNNIPFVKPTIITGIVLFVSSLYIVEKYGIIGVIIDQLFLGLLFNYWYSFYLNLKLLNISLKNYFILLFGLKNSKNNLIIK